MTVRIARNSGKFLAFAVLGSLILEVTRRERNVPVKIQMWFRPVRIQRSTVDRRMLLLASWVDDCAAAVTVRT